MKSLFFPGEITKSSNGIGELRQSNALGKALCFVLPPYEKQAQSSGQRDSSIDCKDQKQNMFPNELDAILCANHQITLIFAKIWL
jgi:hypothetical protein